MLNDLTPRPVEHQTTERPRRNDFRTLEALGGQLLKITALLRAAMNTGAGEEGDEGWLVSLAHDEAEKARATYLQWSLPESGEAQ